VTAIKPQVSGDSESETRGRPASGGERLPVTRRVFRSVEKDEVDDLGQPGGVDARTREATSNFRSRKVMCVGACARPETGSRCPSSGVERGASRIHARYHGMDRSGHLDRAHRQGCFGSRSVADSAAAR
jgi:hypothetical protein